MESENFGVGSQRLRSCINFLYVKKKKTMVQKYTYVTCMCMTQNLN